MPWGEIAQAYLLPEYPPPPPHQLSGMCLSKHAGFVASKSPPNPFFSAPLLEVPSKVQGGFYSGIPVRYADILRDCNPPTHMACPEILSWSHQKVTVEGNSRHEVADRNQAFSPH